MTWKLTDKVVKALTDQAQLENTGSNIYLALALWASDRGLLGTQKYFMAQSKDERKHQIRILKYLLAVDQAVELGDVPAQPLTGARISISEIFTRVLSLEEKVTANLEKIRELCLAEKDQVTYEFLDWFMDEQAKSIDQCRDIISRISLNGDIYELDKWIRKQ